LVFPREDPGSGLSEADDPDSNALSALMVEDNRGDARLVEEALRDYRGARFRVHWVRRLSTAIEYLAEQNPSVVLLDLSLPDSDGLDTVLRIRESAPHCPIVVLTGTDDPEWGLKAIQAGAQDFLLKSQARTASLLGRSLQYAVERRRLDKHLNYLAQFDTLTDLPNRNLLLDRLHQIMSISRRQRGSFAVLFMDLDHFKSVNDGLGHAAGDQLLVEVARRLTGCVRESDTVARLGGDEFVVVLTSLHGPADVEAVAEKIIDSFREPFAVLGQQYFVSTSIGISVFPHDGNTVETLLQNADAAMYRGKQEGRGQYRFYSSSMNAGALERILLANGVRRALERGEFQLYLQPMVDLGTGRTRAMEALLRWEHPDWGLILPGQILPMAEQAGILPDLEEWVLEECVRRIQEANANGEDILRLAVNLSLRPPHSRSLLGRIPSVLQARGVSPRSLEVEITEESIIERFDEVAPALEKLRETGVRVAIDDFGVGNSSLSYLQQLPVDALKIDRSFVRSVPDDADSSTIVRAVVGLAHNLRLSVVAEGVERDGQRDFLLEIGCDLAQGHLFRHPLPWAEALGRENGNGR